jgi:uncharacterized membrane protein
MATSSAVPDLTATTSDERSMAVLAHALQVVGGWIPPLIIFFVKRQSRFVSFHSLQVLFLELVYLAIALCGMLFWFATMAVTILHTQVNHNHFPVAFFAVFAIFWLGWMGVWITKIVVAVIYSIKAGRGEWSEIPVVGGLARSVLRIGRGGEPITQI